MTFKQNNKLKFCFSYTSERNASIDEKYPCSFLYCVWNPDININKIVQINLVFVLAEIYNEIHKHEDEVSWLRAPNEKKMK